jgi:hypothetical protein
MRRRLRALAGVTVLAGMVVVAGPGRAADPAPHFIPGSVIALYDRTGDPRIHAGLDHALAVWNGITHFVLVREQGPADNACYPPNDRPNTIAICTEATGSNGNFSRYPYYPLDGTGHTRNGHAQQCTASPCAGIEDPANVRRILVHEIGHVLGLGHTPRDASGACSIMSVDCYSEHPNDLDRSLLRSAYGHTHRGSTTSTTTVPPTSTTSTTSTTVGTTTTTTTPGGTTTTVDPTCAALAAQYEAYAGNPAAQASIRQQQVARGCPV